MKLGEKIDPVRHGIGMTGDKGTPNALIDGKKKYCRLFVRLRTPQETLTCSPIKDGADFAQRVSIIENWFNSVVRGSRNIVLDFCAYEVSNEEAESMMDNHR